MINGKPIEGIETFLKVEQGIFETNETSDDNSSLFFFFTEHSGFAIFLPCNLHGMPEKFDLDWTRQDLRDNRDKRSPLRLNDQLVNLVQREWKAERKVTLSWSDDMCFPLGSNEGLSRADWAFESQLKRDDFDHP